MKNDKKQQPTNEVTYEGRDQYYMDIDRMINEGMSGGTVFEREEYTNIEEARELIKEDKPNENEN